ncbi:MAG: signal peptidase I [Bacteriovoracaceae bacterium]|jgi:signal peptidase I|nr:signal peptidase I [Bacteriovoracaceae bacterium]
MNNENTSLDADVEKIQKYFLQLKKDIKWIIGFVLVLLIIRSCVIEPYRIPTGSMMPTLVNGDFILVNKFAYGGKFPFTDLTIQFPFTDKPTSFTPLYLYKSDLPRRGEIIVFKYPVDPNINYIKRVIGIPGDVIEIKNKRVYLNNKEMKHLAIENLDLLKSYEKKFQGYNFQLYENSLDDKVFIHQIDKDNFYNQDYKKITIPAGKYFVMGDNRDFSYDSRSWGFVDFSQIKGRAMVVWFSMSFPSIDSQFSLNWNRIGTAL